MVALMLLTGVIGGGLGFAIPRWQIRRTIENPPKTPTDFIYDFHDVSFSDKKNSDNDEHETDAEELENPLLFHIWTKDIHELLHSIDDLYAFLYSHATEKDDMLMKHTLERIQEKDIKQLLSSYLALSDTEQTNKRNTLRNALELIQTELNTYMHQIQKEEKTSFEYAIRLVQERYTAK